MRRALTLAALVGLGLAWGTPTAGAHALLRSSEPEDAALLDSPPTEVSIVFTEPPDMSLSRIGVLDGEGREVETGPLERRSSDTEVAVSLPELGEGVYTVNWRVLSTVDGHVTAGSFSFGVGVDPATVGPPPGAEGAGEIEYPAPSTLSVVGRWSFYLGLALLMGTAIAGLFLFRAPVRGREMATAAAWGMAAVGLVAMFAAERADVGVSVSALLSSDRGELLVGRAAALAAAGAAAAVALARPRKGSFALVAGVTALAMLIHADAGHAGASESWRWLAVGLQWLHIVAVAVWIGGLAWLLLGLRGEPEEASREAVRRFSITAGYALAVVAATGLARALDEVGSLGALFDNGFGLSAVAKSALFGGMVAFGAYNRYRIVPAVVAAGRRVGTLRRTVGGELLLATGIFGITGLMAGLVPPAQIRAAEHHDPAHQRVEVTGSDFATTVRVRLTATPGTPGPNVFEVDVSDFDSGEPVEARRVTLRFSLPEQPEVGRSELPLEREADGTWVGRGTNLSVAGTWSIGVLIEEATDSLQVNLELQTRTDEQDVEIVEGGPGVPDLYRIPLEGGAVAQGYVDPGDPGPNEVHFTFFDGSGEELPIEEARTTAAHQGGHAEDLEPRRLGPGHVVASVELEPGVWTFSVEATGPQGEPLSASFEQEI